MEKRTVFERLALKRDPARDLDLFAHPPVWKSPVFLLGMNLALIIAYGVTTILAAPRTGLLVSVWPGRTLPSALFALAALPLMVVWYRARRCHVEIRELFEGGHLRRDPPDLALQRLLVVNHRMENLLQAAFFACWVLMIFEWLLHLR